MIHLVVRCLSVFMLVFIWSAGCAQSFEGSITYKVEALNPNPKMIPDSTWQRVVQQQFGAQGYMVQKYYYKGSNYLSEIDGGKQKGYQLFNPKDKLLYSWQNNSDTAITVDSQKYMDKIEEIKKLDVSETILGIPCTAIVIKSTLGEMKLWYNAQYFKMDTNLFKGHVYGHWEAIVKTLGCLPLKVEQKGFMAHIIQTATAYKEEAVDDARFILPAFNTIIANPVN